MAERFRTEPDWDDLRVFAALARHGSLSAAARALGVNHATVARRLAMLERALGVKLFERRASGYELTPAGHRALEPAAAMQDAAAGLARLEPVPSLAGLVRITATPSLAEGFLIPRLKSLCELYSALDFEVAAGRSQASLPRYQADIALRLGRPERGEVLGRRVARVGYGLYATTDWRDRLRDGAAPILIGFDEAGAKFPEPRWLAQHFREARVGFRANYQTGQIVAARAGFGIAMLPHFLAAGERSLVEVRLAEAPPLRELWLLTRRDLRPGSPVRIVTDFLVELFRRERGVLEGS